LSFSWQLSTQSEKQEVFLSWPSLWLKTGKRKKKNQIRRENEKKKSTELHCDYFG
jgi:hypothetical protein